MSEGGAKELICQVGLKGCVCVGAEEGGGGATETELLMVLHLWRVLMCTECWDFLFRLKIEEKGQG